MVTIIIDRVNNTNIFNVIHNSESGTHVLRENQSLHSITDDDLIDEYLREIESQAKFSRVINENQADAGFQYSHLDIASRLHQVGETLFRQFFPPVLQTLFRESGEDYIFFHVDPKLASIPFEILSDGKRFLWEKFFIGKSVKGMHAASIDISAKENLNMLIIADPTEDLEWARREGEELLDFLHTRFPEKKLKVDLIAGRSVTKLSLLADLVDRDLIHYAGHLHYTDDFQENGWVLFQNKIIHSREIQKSGASPLLIFSNSCISAGDKGFRGESQSSWYENFASSFIKSGKTNYVGTIWEVPDTQETLSFTLNFYSSLFGGESIGHSLHNSRMKARENGGGGNIAWASYLLLGNPVSRILQPARVPDLSKNVLNQELVLGSYPYPLAEPYEKFIKLDSAAAGTNEKFQALFNLFESTVLFVSALVAAEYSYHQITPVIDFEGDKLPVVINNTFLALKMMSDMDVELLFPGVRDMLNLHRGSIYKLLSWKSQLDRGEIERGKLDGYVISMQYLMEIFLMDLEFLKNYGFYQIEAAGHNQFALQGVRQHHSLREILLPTQVDKEIMEELTKLTTQLKGHFVFYHPVRRVFLDLSPYLVIGTDADDGVITYLNHYHSTKTPRLVKGKKNGSDRSSSSLAGST